MTIREFLKEQREKRGMTQADLAVRAGVGYSTVTKYEQGFPVMEANMSTLQKLCEAFDMTVRIAAVDIATGEKVRIDE